jgi:hypothetical protein
LVNPFASKTNFDVVVEAGAVEEGEVLISSRFAGPFPGGWTA